MSKCLWRTWSQRGARGAVSTRGRLGLLPDGPSCLCRSEGKSTPCTREQARAWPSLPEPVPGGQADSCLLPTTRACGRRNRNRGAFQRARDTRHPGPVLRLGWGPGVAVCTLAELGAEAVIWEEAPGRCSHRGRTGQRAAAGDFPPQRKPLAGWEKTREVGNPG